MKRCVILSVFMIFMSCAGSAVIEKLPKVPQKSPESTKSFVLPQVTGEVRLVFERAIGGKAGLKSPRGISFGIDGTLYLCDRDNSSIIRIDGNGEIISSFSGFDSRTESHFMPSDVSVSGGIEIYVLDSVNSRILRLDRNLKNAYTVYRPDSRGDSFSGISGISGKFGTFRTFRTFGGLAFDQISGDIFVTDRDNGAVIRIDMLGGNIHSSGEFGSERLSLSEPLGLDAGADGSIYVADRGKAAVGVFSYFGGELSFMGEGTLEAPVDVAILPEERFVAADKRGVVVFDSFGAAIALAGYGTDREMSPQSVAFFEGEIYISDANTSQVLVYKIVTK